MKNYCEKEQGQRIEAIAGGAHGLSVFVWVVARLV